MNKVNSSTIKNFILDLGNVILDFNPDRIVSNYTNSLDEKRVIIEAVFNSQAWKDYDKGIANEEDVFNCAKKTLNPSLYNMTKNVIDNWHKHFVLISGADNFINTLLYKGFFVYLLSNTSEKYYEYKHDFPILSKFKGELISASEKLVKPDERIFDLFLKRFNLNPSECFFIDDNINNVNAAISFGINSYQFKGDYNKLYIHLVHKGIFTN